MLLYFQQWKLKKMIKFASCSSIFSRCYSKRATTKFLTPIIEPQFHTHCSDFDSLISSLIASTRSCSSISSCLAIHARVIKSVSYSQGFIGDQLVSLYLHLGNVDYAKKLFDEMPEKDLVSWNSLISGFSRRGDLDECFKMLYRMRYEKGMQPNEVTFLSIISACKDDGALHEAKCVHGLAIKLGIISEVKVANSLIDLYGKYMCLDEARVLFEAMPLHSSVSWNSMIAIYVHNGFSNEGMRFFAMMRWKGFGCDQANIVAMFQACEDKGVAKLAEAIHGLIFNCGLNEDLTTATATMNLYVRLGRLDFSCKVFNEMKTRDSIAWTAMLAGYAVHGQGREAIWVFERMVKDGMKPDHVTFTHLLNACSHSGLVKEGKIYFNDMHYVYGVEPRLDHYSCMVDLLGRSGLVHDAYKLIKCMPMEPNCGVWGALLGACRVHGNIKLGKEVAEQLFALEPSDPRNYIILSNIYSTAGLWKEASSVRVLMKHRGVTRTPGCSFIEHGNKIHRFTVGDQSHPMSVRIYDKLNELMRKIQDSGLAASKTEFVLHDVDEEVKKDMISKHSEKLAIAYGLLVTNPRIPLIITKNLRICGDCHSTAKLISLIENRTIIIRDTKRFHHFNSGSCSCGDYW